MYERYTRQVLPTREYRELLGSAICVFNSNNAFIIENILRVDKKLNYNWHNLIDLTSGGLKHPIKNTITKISNSSEIADLFEEIVKIRNRIIHSFQITNKEGEQILCTKDKDNKQYVISEEFLLDFIKKNETLSTLLHSFRGY